MWLARLRRRLERRRYRDVTIFRAALSLRTEATWFERVARAVRRRERFGYDETEARAGDRFRRALVLLAILFFAWFLLSSLRAVNIFAG